MTKLVEKIYSLAQKASRAEEYATLNAILTLLESEDTQLPTAHLKELERREKLLTKGEMKTLPAEEVLDRVSSKINPAS